MANSPTMTKKAGLTRGKAVLIGILSIVLGGVVYIQFGRSGSDESATSASAKPYRPPAPRAVLPTASQTPAAEAATDADALAAIQDFDQARWKSPELSKVVAYDPFALPAAFPQPPQPGTAAASATPTDDAAAAATAEQIAEALEQLRMQLEELKQRGVHVIISQNDQYVAMIGDRLIHVGDDINGFTVTGIDPDGVRVERKPPE